MSVWEGSAPLRAPESEPSEAAAGGSGFRPGAVALMTPSVSLIDQVRDAMRAARELYHGSARAAALRELAERLDEPLRVAVGGPPGAGSTTLVEQRHRRGQDVALGERSPRARAARCSLGHRDLLLAAP